MPLDIILLVLRIVIALALYVFLGVVLLYLWRDLRAAGEHLPNRQQASGKLVVVQSDSIPIPVGREYALRPLTTLGRGPKNTIVLPDNFASTDHLHVTWRRGHWWLEDLQSRNGTTVNDIPVSEPVVLSSGDEIGVGRVKFRFQIES
jgi:hypothetical protein